MFPLIVKALAGQRVSWSIIISNFIDAVPGILILPFVPKFNKRFGKTNVFLCLWSNWYHWLYTDAEGRWISVTSFLKTTGITIVASYMWVLISEVISYGEYVSGRRVAGIINAYINVFYKIGCTIGGIIPTMVFNVTGYVFW